MSFQSFMNNPKAYLKAHSMQLGGTSQALAPAAMTELPMTPLGGGLGAIQYLHTANVRMMRVGLVPQPKNIVANGLRQLGLIERRQVSYQSQTGGAAVGLRILPFHVARVTFMQLTGGATFAVTGPLTGCTVAVLRHAGSAWLFHANVGAGGGVGAANLLAKRNMIAQAAAGIGAMGAATLCEYTVDYNGIAFVWGRLRGNGDWKFYVHDVTLGGGVQNAKWATV